MILIVFVVAWYALGVLVNYIYDRKSTFPVTNHELITDSFLGPLLFFVLDFEWGEKPAFRKRK